MGLLVDGEWRDQWYDTDGNEGRFVREESQFRHWVTANGEAGPTGDSGFAPEAGRYHLYVANACPWSHRALIFRRLKGLTGHIGLSVVNTYMGENGWTFAPGRGVIADPIHNADYMHQVYTAAKSDYSGRVTVPVLWDKQQQTIVTNESADLIRMFNSAFDAVGASAGDYYPADLREQIDTINDVVYRKINNGVYKAGFATSQDAYEEAVLGVFEGLDEMEQRLSEQRYLCGDRLTEADWRLFVTLIRFDAVYVGHFKCNIRRLQDYPNLSNYTRELYQWPGISETVDLTAYKQHYYRSHDKVNPTGIVPIGPALDLTVPHDRERLPAAE
ncbi:MAG: glutathione S-transferase family protein [Wenzhouxiangellaceae bacterium]